MAWFATVPAFAVLMEGALRGLFGASMPFTVEQIGPAEIALLYGYQAMLVGIGLHRLTARDSSATRRKLMMAAIGAGLVSAGGALFMTALSMHRHGKWIAMPVIERPPEPDFTLGWAWVVGLPAAVALWVLVARAALRGAGEAHGGAQQRDPMSAS